MKFCVLGSVGVDTRDGRLAASGKPGHVLALLLAFPNEALSSERLIDSIWGEEAPKAARNSLQAHVGRLRTMLGLAGKRLVTVGGGYMLEVRTGELDAGEVELLVASGRDATKQGELTAAARYFREGLDLWTGPSFGHWSGDLLIQPEAIRLDELRLSLEEELADVRLALGEHSELVKDLPSLVKVAPYRERRWAQLMLALYRCDRQAEALRTYQDLRQHLVAELGLEPSANVRNLEERMLLQAPELAWSPDPPAVHLPQFLTTVVGRDQQLRELVKLIQRDRLVVVTGVGGIGKTRLSVAAVEEAAQGLACRAYYIDLASSGDLSEIEARLSESIDIDSKEALDVSSFLRDAVRELKAIIVLDNAEGDLSLLLPLVDELLRGSPHLRFVVTSRVPTDRPGETHYRVEALDLPDSQGPDSITPADSESARLLLDRLDIDVGGLTDRDADALARICYSTGGIPLALELAAGLGASMSLEDLATSLEANVFLLDRSVAQQEERSNLTGIVEWSASQLGSKEQAISGVITSFPASWTLEAAVAAARECGHDPEDTAAAVHRLSRMSLVGRSENGRYAMLEPVRQYLRSQLMGDERDEYDAAHATWCRRFIVEAQPHLEGPSQLEWYLRLEAESASIKRMLRWSIEAGDARVLGALPCLSLLWFRRSQVLEGLEWFDRTLAAFDPIAEGSPLALLHGAHIATWGGRPDVTATRLDELQQFADDAGVAPLQGRVRHSRGNLFGWGLGQPGAAIEYFREATSLLREAGDPTTFLPMASEAYMQARGGNLRAAESLVPDFVEVASASFPPIARVGKDQIYGLTALFRGDLVEAENRLKASLRVAEEYGLLSIQTFLLVPLAWTLLLQEKSEAVQVGRDAYRFSTEYSAGWRIAEAAIVLGATASSKGDQPSADRWYSRALDAAARAPEVDSVSWAILGLTATGPSQERYRDLRAEALGVMEQVGVGFPAGYERFFGELQTASSPSFTPERLVAEARAQLT